jgi:hypothetical protein
MPYHPRCKRGSLAKVCTKNNVFTEGGNATTEQSAIKELSFLL